MITAYRHEHNICLNDREWLLECEDGPVLEFNTKSDAMTYLQDNGADATDETALNEDYGIYLVDSDDTPTHTEENCDWCTAHVENGSGYYPNDDDRICESCYHTVNPHGV